MISLQQFFSPRDIKIHTPDQQRRLEAIRAKALQGAHHA
jgi:hypothetical protein